MVGQQTLNLLILVRVQASERSVEGATQNIVSRLNENAGAMFCEFYDEQNREAVVRQNFRKKILVATESKPRNYEKYY